MYMYIYNILWFCRIRIRALSIRSATVGVRPTQLETGFRHIGSTYIHCVRFTAARTFMCGLTRYSSGLARSRSFSSSTRRISSRLAELSTDTSSRVIDAGALAGTWTSGRLFLRCNAATCAGAICANMPGKKPTGINKTATGARNRRCSPERVTTACVWRRGSGRARALSRLTRVSAGGRKKGVDKKKISFPHPLIPAVVEQTSDWPFPATETASGWFLKPRENQIIVLPVIRWRKSGETTCEQTYGTRGSNEKNT